MELTDTQLNYFVDNRLKLPKGKRAEYLAQVDHLIERFAAAAKGDKVINIKKFLKTGSLRKGTVLRPKGDFGVDADVAVYPECRLAPRNTIWQTSTTASGGSWRRFIPRRNSRISPFSRAHWVSNSMIPGSKWILCRCW